MTSFNPDWVSPPGDTIKDLVEEKSLRDNTHYAILDIALCLLLTFEDTEKLLAGELEIDDYLALRLHFFLGPTKD